MGKRIEAALHVAGIIVSMAGLIISFVNGDWMPWMLVFGSLILVYYIVGNWMLRVWKTRELMGGEDEAYVE